MTDKPDPSLATRLREIPVLLDKAPVAYSRTASETCLKAADEIEDLHKKLDACRAGFDRLARQVDGYSRAGKKSESWRKKT